MNLFQALFDLKSEKDQHIFSNLCLFLIYGLGILFWCVFFNWGNFPVNFEDWAYVTAPRLAFLQDAVQGIQLPLHMPDSSALLSQTDRFLAVPDTIISPQVLLTGILNPQIFALINVCLLYSIGFLGLLRFREKYSLSISAFFWLFLLFNFNGHILSHLAVGHLHWSGYFLFPWFFFYLFNLLEGDLSWRWVFSFSLIFFLVFIQGAFHQFVWMLMILGMVGLVFWRKFLDVLKVLLFANLLSMLKILPAVLLFNDFSEAFLGGYPLKRYVLNALINWEGPRAGQAYPAFTNPLGNWEFNLYIGKAGLAFLVFFGLALIIQGLISLGIHWYGGAQVKDQEKGKTVFLTLLRKADENISPMKYRLLGVMVPAGVMAWFSIRDNYEIVRQIGIPLLSSERVATRFLLLTILIVLFLGVREYQSFLDRVRSGSLPKSLAHIIQFVSLLLSGLLAFELWRHALLWAIPRTANAFPVLALDLSEKVVANHADPQYILFISLGLLISLCTLVFLIYMTRQEQIDEV